jgi:hypothetical protein
MGAARSEPSSGWRAPIRSVDWSGCGANGSDMLRECEVGSVLRLEGCRLEANLFSLGRERRGRWKLWMPPSPTRTVNPSASTTTATRPRDDFAAEDLDAAARQ